MSSDKVFYFCIGGIFSILLLMMMQEYEKMESRNAYQQGVIDSQSYQLEYFKGKDNW